MNKSEEGKSVSLIHALSEASLPSENKVFLRPLERLLGQNHCDVMSNYIKCSRENGKPALEIHFGYTTGFENEAEIIEIFGDVDRWESKRSKGSWGVTHPVNKIRDSGNSIQRARIAEEDSCPNCGMVRSKTGICEFCD